MIHSIQHGSEFCRIGELEVVRAALASALDDVETFVREAAALASRFEGRGALVEFSSHLQVLARSK